MDLQDAGIDVAYVMRRRTTRWLRLRVQGLLSSDTRLYRALMKEARR